MEMRVFKTDLLGVEEMIVVSEHGFDVFIDGVFTCSGEVRGMAGTVTQLLDAGYVEVVA